MTTFCKNCTHYIPGVSADGGQCRQGPKVNIVSGEAEFFHAVTMREYRDCGLDGKLFAPIQQAAE